MTEPFDPVAVRAMWDQYLETARFIAGAVADLYTLLIDAGIPEAMAFRITEPFALEWIHP